MSLLPHTLLNSTSNEDQTLEIHSEILEPLSHSQNITRFEIPHKNILDSDSVLVWNVFWDKYSDDATGEQGICLPHLDSGLYDTILRARLFVNGKIISELNEVGKYLTLKSNFVSHEVKVEKDDMYSYADHRIRNVGGKLSLGRPAIQRTPGSREIGPQTPDEVNGLFYRVEASLKLHQLFVILKDAQLDTNNIEGKIMIEIDWNRPMNNASSLAGTNNSVSYFPSNVVTANRLITIAEPRLILDFLTYNAEVQAQIKNTIYGDGPGVNMPFREVALVRKNIPTGQDLRTYDINMGMTGRAVQKIWVAKVMDITNGVPPNAVLNGSCRSDLLQDQAWNIRINDLMIYDRDVTNRAEEYNYFQQAGEKKATLPPGTYEKVTVGITGQGGTGQQPVTHGTGEDIWNGSAGSPELNYPVLYRNRTPANYGGVAAATDEAANRVNCPTGVIREIGEFISADGDGRNNGLVKQGLPFTLTQLSDEMCGHKNYLGINLARYKNGAESPLNAMRIGSTPILFNLTKSGAQDIHVSGKSGELYFWVEYLKMMNLKNGQITVMDL